MSERLAGSCIHVRLPSPPASPCDATRRFTSRGPGLSDRVAIEWPRPHGHRRRMGRRPPDRREHRFARPRHCLHRRGSSFPRADPSSPPARTRDRSVPARGQAAPTLIRPVAMSSAWARVSSAGGRSQSGSVPTIPPRDRTSLGAVLRTRARSLPTPPARTPAPRSLRAGPMSVPARSVAYGDKEALSSEG